MGNFHLLTEQVDYKVVALSVKEKTASSTVSLQNTLPVFINISGYYDNPIYQVDLVSMGMGL
jgi:hypothetical protein